MSFLQDIASFSAKSLRPVETHITTAGGEVFVETRTDGQFSTKPVEGKSLGFVGDVKPDLQIVEVRSGLFLGSQDVASSLDLLNLHGVTHILNVGSGIPNAFPDMFVYENVEILDLPETEITRYFEECFRFIDGARESGKVLVHCNAGVSRAPSIVIAYVMSVEGVAFETVFQEVKQLRPSVRPNDGFQISLAVYGESLRRS